MTTPLLNSTTQGAMTRLSASSVQQPNKPTTKEAFQDFVAGTFFKEMFKALRSSQKEVPYIGGGQGEKLFRSQLDQQMAESMAKTHGAPLTDALYEQFQNRLDALV